MIYLVIDKKDPLQKYAVKVVRTHDLEIELAVHNIFPLNLVL